jgi:hypothetical protein
MGSEFPDPLELGSAVLLRVDQDDTIDRLFALRPGCCHFLLTEQRKTRLSELSRGTQIARQGHREQRAVTSRRLAGR